MRRTRRATSVSHCDVTLTIAPNGFVFEHASMKSSVVPRRLRFVSVIRSRARFHLFVTFSLVTTFRGVHIFRVITDVRVLVR